MAIIEFRLLRYFITIAETGHLTRAAELLGIAQPPLSQQLRQLEDSLGVTLFERLPRGMALTPAGETFLADARDIIARLDHAVSNIQRVGRGERGSITAGLTSSSAYHPFVPMVIRGFRRTAPSVSLVLEEGNTSDLLNSMREGRLDLAFIRHSIESDEDIAMDRLLVEPMVLALPKRHRLARSRSSIAIADLANEPMILYRRRSGHGLYDAIISACQSSGFSPNIVQEAPRLPSAISLVAAEIGVSIVPESLMRMKIEGVIYRQFKGKTIPMAPLNLAYRKSLHKLSPAAERLVAHVRESALQMK